MSLVLGVVRRADCIVGSEGRAMTFDGAILSEHDSKHVRIADSLIVAASGTRKSASGIFASCEKIYRLARRNGIDLTDAVRAALEMESYRGPDDGFQSLPAAFAVVRDRAGALTVIHAAPNAPLAEYKAEIYGCPTVIVLAPCQETYELAMRELIAASARPDLRESAFAGHMREAMELVFHEAARISRRVNTNTSYATLGEGIPGDALLFQRVTGCSGNMINTSSVNNNSINNNGEFSNDSGVSSTTTETSLGSVTISTNGGSVEVTAKGLHGFTSSNSTTYRLRKDGITGTILDQQPSVNVNGTTVVLMGIDTSPASSQTYVVTGQTDTGSTQLTNRRIIAANRKK